MSIPENPINPTEQYLARLAGQNAQLPDHPITRTHQYLEALVGTAGKLEADFNAEMAISPAVVTKRVEGGTQLLNPLWANKTCATVGFAWNPNESKKKLYVCVVFSYVLPDGYTFKKYSLYEKESEEDPYELTLENAPRKEEIPGSVNYKYTDKSTLVSHIDQRFCLQVFDPNGKEVDRIYSAQYRYYANDGNPTRTLVPTAPQDPSYITDICLRAPTSSFYDVMRTFQPNTSMATLYPLVSTPQSAGFLFIVPDTLFEEAEATHGFILAVVMGDGNISYGPKFDKAEDTGPFVVTLTPTEPDYSGVMDKTGDDILQAYFSGRRIRFVVQGFSAGADATMFNLLDDGAGGIAGVIAGAFVVYDAGSGWMNILITSGAYDNTYTTTIFQLTPIT